MPSRACVTTSTARTNSSRRIKCFPSAGAFCNPADEVLDACFKGVASTVAETNNQKLARLKYHICKYSARRAIMLFLLAWGDLHNQHVFKAAARAKEYEARGGNVPARLAKYAEERKHRKCAGLLCWQPGMHVDGCGECAVPVRLPVVVSRSPLVLDSSDGSTPRLRCYGFNNFCRDNEDDFGIVRKIVGRWRGRPVKVEPTLPDGSLGPLQLVLRDEYLVEWMPTRGPRRNKPWPLQWEPASNLPNATTEIDAFEKEATAAHSGRTGPAKWILPDYRKKAPREYATTGAGTAAGVDQRGGSLSII